MNLKETNTHIRRRLTGVVVGDKTQKTRVVAVVRLKKHRKYPKYFQVTTRFKAHDEKNEYALGDRVTIEETRPLSKEKRWKIVGFAAQSKKVMSG